jgi:hypothetical protein
VKMCGHYVLGDFRLMLTFDHTHISLEGNNVSTPESRLSAAWALAVQWVSVLPYIKCLLAC